jgi:hypothetical protein
VGVGLLWTESRRDFPYVIFHFSFFIDLNQDALDLAMTDEKWKMTYGKSFRLLPAAPQQKIPSRCHPPT